MAKPSSVPTWATDANLTSGDESGSSTKLEPAAGVRAQGLVPGRGLVGRYVNWLLNLLCDWVAYVNNLHAEAVGFLDQAFSWTGTHAFSQEIQANGGLDTNGQQLVTSGGTVSTAAGNHATTTGDFVSSGGGDHTTTGAGQFAVSNASGVDSFVFTGTKPSRTVLINLAGAVGVAPGNWLYADGTLASASPNGGSVFKEIALPHGAIVSAMEVHGYQQTDTAVDTAVELMSRTVSGSDLTAPSQEAVKQPTTFTGADVEFTFGTEPSFTVNNNTKIYYLKVTEADSGATNCGVNYVTLTFSDPGPRNF